MEKVKADATRGHVMVLAENQNAENKREKSEIMKRQIGFVGCQNVVLSRPNAGGHRLRRPVLAARLGLGVELTRQLGRGGSSPSRAQCHVCDLGSVFFGVMDVLTIVKVSSGKVIALDGHGAGPGCSTS